MAGLYKLQVVSLDGLVYDGQASALTLRSREGNITILRGHTNYCAALGMGRAEITDADGRKRNAACIGGMVSVMNGDVRVISTTWEWQEDIDLKRAQASKERAEARIKGGSLTDKEYKLTMAKLRRALVRIDVAR